MCINFSNSCYLAQFKQYNNFSSVMLLIRNRETVRPLPRNVFIRSNPHAVDTIYLKHSVFLWIQSEIRKLSMNENKSSLKSINIIQDGHKYFGTSNQNIFFMIIKFCLFHHFLLLQNLIQNSLLTPGMYTIYNKIVSLGRLITHFIENLIIRATKIEFCIAVFC